MNVSLWKGFVCGSLFKELSYFLGEEAVTAETQGKVTWPEQIKQLMKLALFLLSVRSAAKRPHHGVGRLQGHLFSLSETCFSIVGFCFVTFLPRVTFSQGHLLEGQLKQKARLSKERLTHARSGAGWGGRGARKKHFSLVSCLSVCTQPIPSPLSSGYLSELRHPEELACTSYFQYCSPQGSRNHKPSSSKLQDWVKSHENTVKLHFRDLSLCLLSSEL